MKSKNIVFLLPVFGLITALLVSCIPDYPSFDDIRKIKRGMAFRDFQRYFDYENRNYWNLEIDGESFDVYSYKFLLSTDTQQSTTPTTYGAGGSVISYGSTTTTTTYNINTYLFVFRANMLKFWGFLYELRRDDDPVINKIGDEIYGRINIDE